MLMDFPDVHVLKRNANIALEWSYKMLKYFEKRRNSRSFNFRKKVWRVPERTNGGSNYFDFSAGKGT